MSATDRLELNKEQKEEAVKEIIHYFSKERDENIGNLAALLVLKFISEKIGPCYYNKGVQDAQKYMGERVEDLDGLML
jgi:uncharacterized protein (DUF2164 family)